MARFLAVECPNCLTLFAIAQLQGEVSSPQRDSMVLENVDCPHCRQHFPQFTGEVTEVDAAEAPMSGGPQTRDTDVDEGARRDRDERH